MSCRLQTLDILIILIISHGVEESSSLISIYNYKLIVIFNTKLQNCTCSIAKLVNIT